MSEVTQRDGTPLAEQEECTKGHLAPSPLEKVQGAAGKIATHYSVGEMSESRVVEKADEPPISDRWNYA